MATTLLNLVVEFKRWNGQSPASSTEESGSPNNDTIKALINTARHQVYGEISAQLESEFSEPETMTYTASTEAVALPTASKRRPITMVMAEDNNASSSLDRYELQKRSEGELFNENQKGSPKVYGIRFTAGTILLRPIPTQDTTLHIYRIPALSDLTDSSECSELMEEYHKLYAIRAVMLYQSNAGDPEFQRIAAIADQMMSDLVGKMNRNRRATNIKRVR